MINDIERRSFWDEIEKLKSQKSQDIPNKEDVETSDDKQNENTSDKNPNQ